jgi:hypothetical protein
MRYLPLKAVVVNSDNHPSIAKTAGVALNFGFSRNLRAVCWYFSAAILTLRGL